METALLCAILGSQTVTILVQWVLSKIDAKRNPLREGVKELLFCKLKQFDEQREHNGFVPIADRDVQEKPQRPNSNHRQQHNRTCGLCRDGT